MGGISFYQRFQGYIYFPQDDTVFEQQQFVAVLMLGICKCNLIKITREKSGVDVGGVPSVFSPIPNPNPLKKRKNEVCK